MGDQNTNKSSPTRVIIPTEKNVHNTNANPFIIPMARSKYQCPYQNTNAPFKIPKFWYYERWYYERWYFDSDPNWQQLEVVEIMHVNIFTVIKRK